MEITFDITPAFRLPTSIRVESGKTGSEWTYRREGPPLARPVDPQHAEPADLLKDHRTLTDDECRALEQALDGLTVPVRAAGPMGLDGVTYTLSVRAGFTSIKLSWWVNLPEQWAALTPLLDVLEELDRGDTAGSA